jgi:2-dehydro-3-deoxyphosphogluconate aldolase/(4S)-4-hydroxy-2-oxoglutarate aldolase
MVTVDREELRERVGRERIVAIIRGTEVDATVASARTLFDAGIRVLEIPLTLDGAHDAIREVIAAAPADALVGAGTVLTEAQVDGAIAAGAQFVVTPTLTASVPYAIREGVGVLPGVYTPTEIQAAHDLGAAAVKLFPASALGPGYLRAVRDPFPDARIIPVGGVSLDTLEGFFDAGAFAVGVGGPLLGDAPTPGGAQAALAGRARAFRTLLSSLGR